MPRAWCGMLFVAGRLHVLKQPHGIGGLYHQAWRGKGEEREVTWSRRLQLRHCANSLVTQRSLRGLRRFLQVMRSESTKVYEHSGVEGDIGCSYETCGRQIVELLKNVLLRPALRNTWVVDTTVLMAFDGPPQ